MSNNIFVWFFSCWFRCKNREADKSLNLPNFALVFSNFVSLCSNKSVSRSVNQLISQSVSWSVSQSVSRLLSQSAGQWVSCLVSEINELIKQASINRINQNEFYQWTIRKQRKQAKYMYSCKTYSTTSEMYFQVKCLPNKPRKVFLNELRV